MTSTEQLEEGWYVAVGDRRSHYYVREWGKSICLSRGGVTLDWVALRADPELDPCKSCIRKLRQRRPDLEAPEPIANGFTLTPSRGQTRIELECRHQHGLIYVTEGAEANFVCSSRRRPAHSLSGFFLELGQLQDNRVKDLMQRWGLYFRSLPLEVDDNDDAEANQPVSIPVGTAAGHQGAGDGPEGEHSP